MPAVGIVAKQSEDEPQAHRSSTHKGFRPEICGTSAFAIFATPALNRLRTMASTTPRRRVSQTLPSRGVNLAGALQNLSPKSRVMRRCYAVSWRGTRRRVGRTASDGDGVSIGLIGKDAKWKVKGK